MSVAWLFPGQGSQAVGMGADVARTFNSARDAFDVADRALGEQLSRVIAEGPEETLTLTENAQPALVATSLAVLAALRELAPDLSLPRPSRPATRSASTRRSSQRARSSSRTRSASCGRGARRCSAPSRREPAP